MTLEQFVSRLKYDRNVARNRLKSWFMCFGFRIKILKGNPYYSRLFIPLCNFKTSFVCLLVSSIGHHSGFLRVCVQKLNINNIANQKCLASHKMMRSGT